MKRCEQAVAAYLFDQNGKLVSLVVVSREIACGVVGSRPGMTEG